MPFFDVLDFKGGNQPPKQDFVDRPLPGYIRLLQIRDFGSDEKAVYIKSSKKWQTCNEEDILIGRYGASVGKVLRGKSGAYNVALIKMIIKDRLIETKFLYYWLQDSAFQDKLSSVSRSAQNGFNKEDLRALVVPVPPIAEQRRIVARIEALFVRIRRARADLERVEPLAHATMKAAINSGLNGSLTAAWRHDNPDHIWTGNQVQSLEQNRTKYLAGRRGVRLARLPEFQKPGVDKDLPLTWLRGCIADAATLKLGYAFKSDWFSKSGPKLLRGANISPGRLDWSDEKLLSPALANEFTAYRVRVGDIVIAMDRPMISTGLKIARVPLEDDGSLLVQRVASPELSGMLDTGYLWYVLQASEFLEQIERRSTGSDLPHISGNDILDTVMPIPPLLEQRQIAAQLDKVAAKLLPIRTDSRRALALLDRLEDGILALAFRGEFVPQDRSGESAVLSLAAIEALPRTRKRRAA